MANLNWDGRPHVVRGQNWGLGITRSVGSSSLASHPQAVVQRNSQGDEGLQVPGFMPEQEFVPQALAQPLQEHSLRCLLILPRV